MKNVTTFVTPAIKSQIINLVTIECNKKWHNYYDTDAKKQSKINNMVDDVIKQVEYQCSSFGYSIEKYMAEYIHLDIDTWMYDLLLKEKGSYLINSL